MDFFVTLQHLLPRYALTRLTGRAAASQRPWLKRRLIRAFAHAYDIHLNEAECTDFEAFTSFNAFFTRALARGVRPLAGTEQQLVSPVDARISQIGAIEQGTLFQAKGRRYSLTELTGADANTDRAADAAQYEGGRFATLYLAPSDYHRIHVPLPGVLTRATAIPGTLFSVNGRTEAGIANLFCRNERLALEFDTERGPLFMVLVGALIVGAIETVFPGPRSPYRERSVHDYSQAFERGAEVGRFLLGSTVILGTGPGYVDWGSDAEPGRRVRVGAFIGDRD
ncbi:MAG: archaetidylserine decarboxylase [Pseudomonadota bacterium]